MPGLVPGIHVLLCSGHKNCIETAASPKDVDGRDKPGHDEKLQYGPFNMNLITP